MARHCPGQACRPACGARSGGERERECETTIARVSGVSRDEKHHIAHHRNSYELYPLVLPRTHAVPVPPLAKCPQTPKSPARRTAHPPGACTSQRTHRISVSCASPLASRHPHRGPLRAPRPLCRPPRISTPPSLDRIPRPPRPAACCLSILCSRACALFARPDPSAEGDGRAPGVLRSLPSHPKAIYAHQLTRLVSLPSPLCARRAS